jgi:hypothetical protein
MGLLAILAHKEMGALEHPSNCITVHMVNTGSFSILGKSNQLIYLIKCYLCFHNCLRNWLQFAKRSSLLKDQRNLNTFLYDFLYLWIFFFNPSVIFYSLLDIFRITADQCRGINKQIIHFSNRQILLQGIPYPPRRFGCKQ